VRACSSDARAARERIIKNQALGDPSQRNSYMMSSKKTMEVNGHHPIVKTLLAHVVAGATTDDDKAIAHLLLETAKLQSGYSIDNPKEFADAVSRFVAKQLGVQDEKVVELDEEEAPDATPEDADADAADDAAAAEGKDEL
jgi:HSP90 family molecular chaperone